ncbi:hypothetical protein GCM10027347_58800 [Larkinella harenae]
MISNALGFITQNVGPSLNLDFTQGILNPALNFSRNSIGTYFDGNGNIQTAAAGVPKLDYDPITKQPKGILIEEPRTNLAPNSNDLNGPSWIKTAITTTKNATIFGVLNSAWTVAETNSTTSLLFDLLTIANGQTITGSVWVKRGNHDWLRVMLTDDTATAQARVWINLATGAIGSNSVSGGAAIIGTPKIIPYGDSWYRIEITATLSSFTSVRFCMVSADNDLSLARVASANHLQYEAQVEVGAFATSIIPTGAGSVLRNGDVPSLPIGSWYNGTAGSWFIQFIPTLTTGNRELIALPSPLRIPFYHNSVLRTYTSSDYATANTITINSINKGFMSYVSSGNISLWLNNGSPVTGAIFNNLEVTGTFYIGSRGNTNFLNGWIQKIQYWPRRLTISQLQLLTA